MVGLPAGPKPFVALARPGCAQLFLIYQGKADRLMMDPADFWRLTRILDRNLVMFRDAQTANYLKGISPEIPDIVSFIEWQQAYRDERPYIRETYCVGTSMGAYAALILGCFLPARTVWAFAPRPALYPSIYLRPGERSKAKLAKLTKRLEPLLEEVVAMIDSSGQATDFRVYYNEPDLTDRWIAERLAKSRRVTLFPQGGPDHYVIPAIHESGGLANLFPPFKAARKSRAARAHK